MTASRSDVEAYVAEPRETLTVEHKSWLDLSQEEGKAKLAKATMAMANHGGGVVVIGFKENRQAGGALISEDRPAGIERYGVDAINAAVARYARPAFHCDLHFAIHQPSGFEHAVIVVPGGHKAPILTSRDCERVVGQNKIYVRKPGPKSEEARTPEEWADLLERCVRARQDALLDAFRTIMSGSAEAAAQPEPRVDRLADFTGRAEQRWISLTEHLPQGAPAKFPLGGYDIGIAIEGELETPSLAALMQKIEEAHQIKLTGWPTFLTLTRQPIHPRPMNGLIETWLGYDDAPRTFNDPGHQDFWWIAPEGLLAMKRGFQEDGIERVRPGTALDFVLPIWRTGEALLYASRFGAALGSPERLRFMFRWHGLKGRALVSIDNRRMFHGDRKCEATDEVVVSGSATIEQIENNLSEVLFPHLTKLYEVFDFFRLSPQAVAEEVARLRERRF